MKPVTRKQRLDEILLSEGQVSEQEVQEALLRQKAHGGKFGSQLLYHRCIDEVGLVKALVAQLGCEGVVLSKVEIPEAVIKLVPKKVALTRKVLPFDYDPGANLLKIACEDPTDPTLINELGFLTSGKKIKLYVAAELALNTAIARHYLGRDVSLDDNLLLEIPDAATAAGLSAADGAPQPVRESVPSILLVTDEAYAAPLLQSLLEREGCHAVIAGSVEEAVNLLEEGQFSDVFIRNTVVNDDREFVDHVRRISPGTSVRAYSSISSLFLQSSCIQREADLLLKNLDLFTSLLSARAARPVNHSGRVGRYADKLCHKLGLTVRDRMLITNAAYVHDLAWFYGRAEEAAENRQVVERTVKLLASLDYLPEVLEILQHMYRDLPGTCADTLPLEVLGGNILTVVDLFCDSIPQGDRLSLDRVDAVKRRLRGQVGRLFLPEVVEAFIEIMQEEMLDLNITRRSSQAMIYADDVPLQQLLELLLKNEGYRTVAHNSSEACVELYRRSAPDLLILGVRGDAEHITSLVAGLADAGISFECTPTFLLVDTVSTAELSGLVESGIRDIIPLDTNLDRLTGRIRALQSKLNAKNGGHEGPDTPAGARGRLTDMNLIDLLQALGPSRKTVRITVLPPPESSSPLTIYLDQGSVVFAELGRLIGAEAVYEGLTWTEGAWTVASVSPAEIPPPNNQLSNESILMEGCRLLDERVKTGQLL